MPKEKLPEWETTFLSEITRFGVISLRKVHISPKPKEIP